MGNFCLNNPPLCMGGAVAVSSHLYFNIEQGKGRLLSLKGRKMLSSHAKQQ